MSRKLVAIHISRVAKRMELALRQAGIEFHKTRPTRLLLSKMKSSPDAVLTLESETRFTTLFKLINAKIDRLTSREAVPFN